jgi:hypothetical protein
MRRRTFLATGAAALSCGGARNTPMDILDYGLSTISGKAAWNRVRFWVESRTRIIDERSRHSEDYLQCGACKSEDTFAARNLFTEPNYDFTPIFGPEYGLIFRRKAANSDRYKEMKRAAEMWEGQEYRLRMAKDAILLDSNARIREATHAGWPLVAQTEIHDAASGLRAILEYPVKTMNIHDEKDLYQVDTGPVALPDLSRHEPLAGSISLAFVAFNAPHFADFVIETPTSAGEGVWVHHYAKIVSRQAENRLYAIRIP